MARDAAGLQNVVVWPLTFVLVINQVRHHGPDCISGYWNETSAVCVSCPANCIDAPPSVQNDRVQLLKKRNLEAFPELRHRRDVCGHLDTAHRRAAMYLHLDYRNSQLSEASVYC